MNNLLYNLRNYIVFLLVLKVRDYPNFRGFPK